MWIGEIASCLKHFAHHMTLVSTPLNLAKIHYIHNNFILNLIGVCQITFLVLVYVTKQSLCGIGMIY